MARNSTADLHLVARSRYRQDALLLTLLIVVVVLLILLAIWAAGLRQGLAAIEERRDFENKVDALKLPVRFVIDEPECANRLLEEMGIENVRVRRLDEANLSPPASE